MTVSKAQNLLFHCAIIVPLALYAAQAEARTFSDVQTGDFGYEAVQLLSERSIMDGYDDGSFRPNQLVNRAEAIKVLTATRMTEADANAKTSVYTDVPSGSWYLPHVEYARKTLGIIDGPPKTSAFAPARGITKAEFLKMMLLAYGVDPNAYGEISLPLSSDTSASEWYYPFLRYSVSTSVALPNSTGKFALERPLNRIDVAVLLYRYLLYREKARNQFLLDQAQSNLVITLNALEKSDVRNAEYASARALLSARGAHASMPDEPLVKAVVKLTEGFRSLVRAYQAGISQNLDDAIKLSGDAWYLGDQAKKLSGDISPVATQLQNYAKTLADSARTRQ